MRTRATKVPGGWRIDGRKVWTTNAHRCDFMIALLRTSPPPDPRAKHQGLSQFLVDLRSSGLTIRPILDLVGEEDSTRSPSTMSSSPTACWWARRAMAGNRPPPSWPSSGPGRSATSPPCRC
ncbi:acyl-CoA dehydrogenase family protein [Siccirubricoccus deserti]